MNLRLLILLFFIIQFNGVLFSQPDWQYLGSQYSLTDIVFINDNTGYSTHRDLIRTTNKGDDWFIVNTGTNNSFSGIQFTDGIIGYAAGFEGTFIKSTNSGINWFNTFAPTGYNWSLFFLNNNTGWVGSYQGILKYTNNGGSTWTVQNTGTNNHIIGITFINGTTGWACGDDDNNAASRIFHTTNSGAVWQIQYNSTLNSLNSLAFVNSTTGWCGGDGGLLLKTTDAGTSWNQVLTGYSGRIAKIKFINALTGYFTTSTALLKTTNGGNSFQEIFSSSYALQSSFLDDAGNGYLGGIFSTIFRSTNNGVNWVQTRRGPFGNPYGIVFTSAQTGYLVGQNGFCMKTTDGGDIWFDLDLDTDLSLYDLFFLNDNTGWVSGVAGKVWYTTNGGANWSSRDASTGALNSIFFLNENTGWAAGDETEIVKTTNGGLSWIHQGISGFYYKSIYFINENTGWAGGLVELARTTNTGNNWTYSASGIVTSVNFFSNLGIAAGFAGDVIRSTNYGANWNSITTGISSDICEAKVFDLNRMVLLGTNEISRSTNGGLNWNMSTFSVGAVLVSAHFPDYNTGWAVGEGAYVIKTTNAGSLTAIGNNTQEIQPKEYLTCITYPNPFNPTTNITFELPSFTKNLNIKIYDISGKVIEHLLNIENCSSGLHSISWNADTHPSGVYFIRINADNLSSTVKLVLLK